MHLVKLLFGFNGRIGRRPYWLCFAALVAVVAGVIVFDELAWRVGASIRQPLILVSALAVIPITIKRLHDSGRSWRTLAALIMILALCAGLEALRKYMSGAPIWDEYFTPYTVVSFPVAALMLHLLFPVAGLATALQLQRIALKSGSETATAADFGMLLAYVFLFAIGAWFLWQVGFKRGTQGANRYGLPDGQLAGAAVALPSRNVGGVGSVNANASGVRPVKVHDIGRMPYWLGAAAVTAAIAGIGLWYQFAGTSDPGFLESSKSTKAVTAEDGVTYKPEDEGNCWTSPPLLPPAQARATDLNIVDVCTRLLKWQLKQSRSDGEILRSYSYRGGAYRRLGRLDEAMADSQSALKHSSDGASYIVIGQVHLDRKEFAKALESFDAYKTPAPFSDQMLGRAKALDGLGRKQEAIEAYKEYEKVFGDGMMGYSVKKTANEALIRLGDRQPEPVAPPAKEQAPAPSPPSGGGGGGGGRPGLGGIL